ncbi:MAG: hypothetical protein NVSMB5_12250 [Candidatus Velthaea sp.]
MLNEFLNRAGRALRYRPEIRGGEAKRVARATENVFLYALLPGWLIPGVLDYAYHRRTKIERSSGTHEALLHCLMMTAAGAPVLLGLFLEIEAAVIAAMFACVVGHEALTLWDVEYAFHRRFVSPGEQHTHSFLEVLPIMAFSYVVVLHPQQTLALLGRGAEPMRLELRLKNQPLPPAYIAAILAGVFALVVIPYAEEFMRCYRTDHTLGAHPPAEETPEPP